jgi:aquaporin Z
MAGNYPAGGHGYVATSWGRILWYLLADIRRLRQCSARCGVPWLGIGFLGVSFAFGLTVLTVAYAVGHVSAGHFNCLWAGGRVKATDVLPYILTQVAGAIAAAAGTQCDRLGQTRMGSRGVCVQRLRRSQSRKIRSGVVLSDLLLLRHRRHHLERRVGRICRATLPDPGHQRLRQSGASTGPALLAGGAYIAQLWLF